MIVIAGTAYTSGVDRNNPDAARHHLYTHDQNLPMCDYGWNRSNGERMSILRGWTSQRGECKICRRRALANADPILEARPHKTKWI